MPVLLLVLLIVVPIAELYVIVQVGQGIGVVPTMLLLVAVSLLGSWLLKREGTRAWRALQAATRAGRVPAAEVADGALVVLGGALLLTPGFLTDVVGLLLVLPPSRAAVRRFLTGTLARRLLGPYGALGLGLARGARRRRRRGAAGAADRPYGPGGAPREPRRVDDRVVEGTVVDEPPQRPGA